MGEPGAGRKVEAALDLLRAIDTKGMLAYALGTAGRLALPNMLVFQVVFPLLSPIGDLVFLLSILRGDFGAIAAGYLTFLALDFAGSFVAFRLDRRSLGRLWVVLIQRFFYRQFMYILTFRAVFSAVKGRRHGWNKLDRRATVPAARPAIPSA